MTPAATLYWNASSTECPAQADTSQTSSVTQISSVPMEVPPFTTLAIPIKTAPRLIVRDAFLQVYILLCKYFMTSYESGRRLQKSAVPTLCTQEISDRKAGQNLQDLRPTAIVQPSCFRFPEICFSQCNIYNGCGNAGPTAADNRFLRIDTFQYE